MKKFPKYLLILLLVSLASCVVLLSYRPYLGIDDAYIYFVYAKNLANGHGFVYNVGGERVEGFTSMLWVMICSLSYRLFTVSYFRQALMVLNIGMVSFALFRLTDFLDRRFAGKSTRFPTFPSFCLLAILFVVKGYLDWTVMSLLETGLWSACLIVIIVCLLEICYAPPAHPEPLVFGLLLLVLVLTRPESLLLGIVFLAIRFFLIWYKKQSFISALQAAMLPTLFFIVTFSGLVLFRLHYFGYPYPNTYYAKVSSDHLYNVKEGIRYFYAFVLAYPVYWIPMIVLLASLWGRIRLLSSGWRSFLTFREDELAQTCIAMISAVAFLVPLMVGGDHFSLFRIYQPFAPVLLLLLFNRDFIRRNFFSWEIKKLPGAIPRPIWLILLLPVVYLMNTPKYFLDRPLILTSMKNEFYAPYSCRQVSTALNSFFDFSPRPSIGRILAGGYAFFYDGPTIDLMGLNNTLMAHANRLKVGIKNHASFDKPTFYKLQPDFVDGNFVNPEHFELSENTAEFQFKSNVLKGIFKDSAFLRLYQPVLVSRPGAQTAFFSYIRVGYIDFLRQKSYQVIAVQHKK